VVLRKDRYLAKCEEPPAEGIAGEVVPAEEAEPEPEPVFPGGGSGFGDKLKAALNPLLPNPLPPNQRRSHENG
jgi:hypothetical protein